MSYKNIVAGEWGHLFLTRFVEGGTVRNISDYEILQMFLIDPDGVVSDAKTATFVTDGSDGYIQYTTVEGDIPSGSHGHWRIYGRVISSLDAPITSLPHSFKVYPRLDVVV